MSFYVWEINRTNTKYEKAAKINASPPKVWEGNKLKTVFISNRTIYNEDRLVINKILKKDETLRNIKNSIFTSQ